MRTSIATIAALVMVLAGMAAFAQTCPSEAIMVPASVCPPATSVVPVGPSCPAVLDAGPAPVLANVAGADFDRAYIEQMHQLHTNIIALATQGIGQSTDRNLKDISGRIRYERTKQSEVLAMKYRNMGLGQVPVDYSTVQPVIDSLACLTGAEFNTHYAVILNGMLMQERDAAQLGMSRLCDPRLKNQAAIAARTDLNEIGAVNGWLGGRIAPAACSRATAPACSMPEIPICPAAPLGERSGAQLAPAAASPGCGTDVLGK